MYTFTVQIRFSDEVNATADQIAARDGEAARRYYLEKKLDNALEGGYFDYVEIDMVQPKAEPTVCGFELEDGSVAHYEV